MIKKNDLKRARSIHKFKERPNFTRALIVYKIMRIRMKISYQAWRKLITVKELILNSIMETYIAFSVNKFEPLDLETLMGDSFKP